MSTQTCIARLRMRPSLSEIDDDVEFETWCGQKRIKNADVPVTFSNIDGALAILPGHAPVRTPCPACVAAIQVVLSRIT